MAFTPLHDRVLVRRNEGDEKTSGGLIIGVNPEPPIAPKLEIVKHPPLISSGKSMPFRALTAMLPISLASSKMPFESTSLITGTSNPFSVSTAMPM